jgi:dTDP-4-amino-4,6-dideoxygalactose transaminase
VFSNACQGSLQRYTNTTHTLLTNSCTGAFEMSAELINLSPGHEIIVPSYTFASTANAFLKSGATPVFIDIRKDTLNID